MGSFTCRLADRGRSIAGHRCRKRGAATEAGRDAVERAARGAVLEATRLVQLDHVLECSFQPSLSANVTSPAARCSFQSGVSS